MNEKDILKIVEESFDSNISAWADNTILGIESGVNGKKEFLSDVMFKLKILFDENDLSK